MRLRLFSLVIGLCLWASPVVAMPMIEAHSIDTSAAFGTFTPPPGFGSPINVVAAGTTLSSDIDQSPAGPSLSVGVTQMLKDDPLVPDSFGDLMISELGTIDNLAFLTGTLPDFGNAGDNLVAELNQLLTDLESAHPLVTFAATLTPAGDRFLGDINVGPIAIDTLPEPDVIHIGSVTVDLYRIDMTVTATQTPGPGPAVPEPASAVLGVLGLAALMRRRARYVSVSCEHRRARKGDRLLFASCVSNDHAESLGKVA